MLTMDSGTLQKRLWQPLWLDEKKMLVKPLRGAQWSKENHHFVSVKGDPTDHFGKIRKSFDTSGLVGRCAHIPGGRSLDRKSDRSINKMSPWTCLNPFTWWSYLGSTLKHNCLQDEQMTTAISGSSRWFLLMTCRRAQLIYDSLAARDTTKWDCNH